MPEKRHRAELAHRLRLVGLHPPTRVVDIPEQWAPTCFDLLPIHEQLRTRDFPTTRNCLGVALCNIHDESSSGSMLPPWRRRFVAPKWT